MKGREVPWAGGGKERRARESCGGCGGAGRRQRRRAGAQKEEQRPRGRPCRAGHSGAPAAVKRFQGCNASFWWWRPTFLELTPRKWSPAPAGWGSWRGTGLRRGGGHGVGVVFYGSATAGNWESLVRGSENRVFCTEAAAEMNSSLRGILKINEDIRRRSRAAQINTQREPGAETAAAPGLGGTRPLSGSGREGASGRCAGSGARPRPGGDSGQSRRGTAGCAGMRHTRS